MSKITDITKARLAAKAKQYMKVEDVPTDLAFEAIASERGMRQMNGAMGQLNQILQQVSLDPTKPRPDRGMAILEYVLAELFKTQSMVLHLAIRLGAVRAMTQEEIDQLRKEYENGGHQPSDGVDEAGEAAESAVEPAPGTSYATVGVEGDA